MKRWPTEKANTVGVLKKVKVRGTLGFPIDMLRYDAAHPASEEDSNLINRTLTHDTRGPVEVEIRMRHTPTVGRWESFGWTVVSVGESYEQ